jgi:hypothetical protein
LIDSKILGLLDELGFVTQPERTLGEIYRENIFPRCELNRIDTYTGQVMSAYYYGQMRVRADENDTRAYVELPLGDGDRPQASCFHDMEEFGYALEYLKLRFEDQNLDPKYAGEALVLWMMDPYYDFNQLMFIASINSLSLEMKKKLITFRLDFEMFKQLADGVPLSWISEVCGRDFTEYDNSRY